MMAEAIPPLEILFRNKFPGQFRSIFLPLSKSSSGYPVSQPVAPGTMQEHINAGPAFWNRLVPSGVYVAPAFMAYSRPVAEA